MRELSAAAARGCVISGRWSRRPAYGTLDAVSTAAELVDALLRLPADERAAAAQELLDSLADDAPTAGREHARAWQEEVDRRIAAVDAGEVVMEDGERALAQLRERAAARSARRQT